MCSFVQWRSIVAIFTTCLPNPKRDSLPPQYNVARYDVFFMFFVTVACLLLDVATLAIFFIALAVLLVQAARTRFCGKKSVARKAPKKFFEWRGKSKKEVKQNGMSLEMQSSFHSTDEENQGIEVTHSGTIKDSPKDAAAILTGIIDKAENMIFPVDTTDNMSVGSRWSRKSSRGE